MLVEPNRIDFRKALRGFVELPENPMVFTLVLSILGVYILLLIWARRRDIRNAKKVKIVSTPFSLLASSSFFSSCSPSTSHSSYTSSSLNFTSSYIMSFIFFYFFSCTFWVLFCCPLLLYFVYYYSGLGLLRLRLLLLLGRYVH